MHTSFWTTLIIHSFLKIKVCTWNLQQVSPFNCIHNDRVASDISVNRALRFLELHVCTEALVMKTLEQFLTRVFLFIFKINLPFIYSKILRQSNTNLPGYMFLLKSLKFANCGSTGKKKSLITLMWWVKTNLKPRTNGDIVLWETDSNIDPLFPSLKCATIVYPLDYESC